MKMSIEIWSHIYLLLLCVAAKPLTHTVSPSRCLSMVNRFQIEHMLAIRRSQTVFLMSLSFFYVFPLLTVETACNLETERFLAFFSSIPSLSPSLVQVDCSIHSVSHSCDFEVWPTMQTLATHSCWRSNVRIIRFMHSHTCTHVSTIYERICLYTFDSVTLRYGVSECLRIHQYRMCAHTNTQTERETLNRFRLSLSRSHCH